MMRTGEWKKLRFMAEIILQGGVVKNGRSEQVGK